jgi:SAM-dependent methyltransferase
MKTDTDKGYFYDRLCGEKEWDDFANTYETQRRIELVFERLLKPGEVSDKMFLDAGSGGGHFSRFACELGGNVFSMDVGCNLLAQLRSLSLNRKVAGSILSAPFKDRVFDVVLCTEVIEHTSDPLKGLGELSRLVKDGGLMIVTTPGRLWNPVVKLATAFRLRPYEGYENFLWPCRLAGELVRRGFVVELLLGFNFGPIFLKRFDPIFRFLDKLYGKRLPWLMLNFAVRARKKVGEFQVEQR